MTAAPAPPANGPRVSPLALAFQTDLDRLIAEPAPGLVQIWPALGLGLLAALTLAAALLPVDVVITAPGRIAADAPPMLLRPNARAVLQDLLVRPGDLVLAGQVLARLDSTLPQADRAALMSEARSLRAEIARAEAEVSGADLTIRTAEDAQQAGILAQHRAQDAARLAGLDAAIAGLQAEAATLSAMAPALAERLEIAQQVEAMRQNLADRNTGPKIDALVARAARLAAEAEVSALRARQSDLARRLRAAQDDRAVFAADLPRDAAEALPRLRLRLTQINDALAKASHLAALTEIVAPQAGVVISVAPGGVGAIMAEAEPLVVLIPTDAGLVADLTIASSDLGRVAVGDLVTLKIDAFPYRRFGLGQGRIDSLGPVSVTPEGGTEARHPARISLLSPPPDLPQGMALVPGMTLSAEVRTGTRSVLDYFLDPIERGLSESLREP